MECEKLQTHNLGVYRNIWLHHVERMTNDRLSKQAMFYKPTEKRLPGGPWKRWLEFAGQNR